MISEKEILNKLDEWLQSDDAKKIQDTHQKVTIIKRNDPTNTSLRQMSIIDALGRILLLDYVFCTYKDKMYVKDDNSVKKVKEIIGLLN